MKRFVSILLLVSASALSAAERVAQFGIINGNRKDVVVRYDPSISPAKNNSTSRSPSVGRSIRSSSPQVAPLASITVEPKKTVRLPLFSSITSFAVTVEIEGFESLKEFRICSLRDALIIMPECDDKIKIIQGLKQSAIMTKDSAPIVDQRHTLTPEEVDECYCSVQ